MALNHKVCSGFLLDALIENARIIGDADKSLTAQRMTLFRNNLQAIIADIKRIYSTEQDKLIYLQLITKLERINTD